MPKFTPGPWHIYEEETEDGGHTVLVRDDDTGELGYHIINEDGEPVAVLTWPHEPGERRSSPLDHPERLYDNAQLIAAAPTMYDLLREIVAAPMSGDMSRLVREGWYLIHRIEGETDV